jgi:hypothetical protein
MLTKSAIEQCECNPKRYTCNIRNPILHISAAPKGRLDELYETAKGARSNKDGDQPNAACARQWKSQSCKGNQMHDFIASIRRWGRLLDRPKHGYCQHSCDYQCKRDIEILSHVNRL